MDEPAKGSRIRMFIVDPMNRKIEDSFQELKSPNKVVEVELGAPSSTARHQQRLRSEDSHVTKLSRKAGQAPSE